LTMVGSHLPGRRHYLLAARVSLAITLSLPGVSAHAQSDDLARSSPSLFAIEDLASARLGVPDPAPALPNGRRPSDRPFNLVVGSFITAASTDLAVSMYQIGRGVARESGFGGSWQDKPVLFATTKSAMAAAFVYGLQRVHKTRPKTALVMGAIVTGVEGWLVVRSARIEQGKH
jgi:hypothetical protein